MTTALTGFSNRTGNSDAVTQITLILLAVIILIAVLVIVISAKRTKRKNKDEYPHGADGKPLYLLAQINFAELPEKNSLLPEKGLLQIFVSGDVCSGANFDNQTDQSNFRVIYHAEIDASVTEQSVKALGIKAPGDAKGTDDEDYLPLSTQERLSFEAFTDYSQFGTDECDALVEKILHEKFGIELIDGSVWKTFNDAEYDYLTNAFEKPWCSKILGLLLIMYFCVQ